MHGKLKEEKLLQLLYNIEIKHDFLIKGLHEDEFYMGQTYKKLGENKNYLLKFRQMTKLVYKF